MMRNGLLLSSLVSVFLLAGCGRARVQTDIRPDGTWTRTVAFTGQEKKEGMMTPSLEDVFAIPSGAPWKTEKSKQKDDNVLVTISRNAGAGETLKGDVALKGEEGGKVNFTNEATVTRTGKRIEYKETLRWVGPPPKDFGKVKPEDLAEIKAVLPAPLNTDANATALAGRAAQAMIPLLFGPGDPLLALGLLHPDLAERRATQRIGSLMLKAMEEQFGDKLKPGDRQAIVRKLVEKGFSSAQPSKPDPSSGPPSKGSSGGLTPLMFIVKLPGKVVSHNGQLDELTGEIYWALFPEAAVLKEVTLTAVSETDK